MVTVIRPAEVADVDAASAIYAREVREGYATFATEAPDAAWWRAKVEGPDPFVVGEIDARVVAIAYASEFRPRAAYHLTRETSLYLAPEAQGRGLGTRLYADLLQRLRDGGAHTALAMVSQPNPASVRLHLAAGFVEVGTMREVGDKLGRMIDVTVLQLVL